jgi:hypothetical protein
MVYVKKGLSLLLTLTESSSILGSRVKSSTNHRGEAQGHLLTRRRFKSHGSLASRQCKMPWLLVACLLFTFHADTFHFSLTNALTLAKSVLVLIDILNIL